MNAVFLLHEEPQDITAEGVVVGMDHKWFSGKAAENWWHPASATIQDIRLTEAKLFENSSVVPVSG